MSAALARSAASSRETPRLARICIVGSSLADVLLVRMRFDAAAAALTEAAEATSLIGRAAALYTAALRWSWFSGAEAADVLSSDICRGWGEECAGVRERRKGGMALA